MADDKSGKPPPLMGATAIRPPDRVGMEKYTHIIYDPKNGTFFTRTPKSWALITIFYCIYYSCLAAFWMACMTIFLKIQINDKTPTWMLDDSIIGTKPGIGVRPSQADEEVDSGIFHIDDKFSWNHGTNEEQIQKAIKKDIDDLVKAKKWGSIKAIGGSKGYAYRAHDFFKAYGKNDSGDALTTCAGDAHQNADGYRSDKYKFCEFEMAKLGECRNFPYGYSESNLSPCVFLKLNRIMGLKPTPITADNAAEQDASLLKDDGAKKLLEDLKTQGYPAGVYIKCEGAYPADKEILRTGTMDMYPKAQGIENAAIIPLKYFPYDKKRDHNENPLVAVQFNGLFDTPLREGRLVHVICKAYYDQVVHSKKNKAGLVKFELYLNEKK